MMKSSGVLTAQTCNTPLPSAKLGCEKSKGFFLHHGVLRKCHRELNKLLSLPTRTGDQLANTSSLLKVVIRQLERAGRRTSLASMKPEFKLQSHQKKKQKMIGKWY
jgi:hypothetical protein